MAILKMGQRPRKHGAKRGLQRGTSLIELLVVIVVLLTGILAVIQIFPGGLRLLTTTRNNSVATQLARTEVERLKARPDQLPEQIVPVRYVNTGSGFRIEIESDRRTNELGPVTGATTFGGDGNLVDNGGGVLGRWTYFTGANAVRRVIGEAIRIPAPAPTLVTGTFASLSALQFGPVLLNGYVKNFDPDGTNRGVFQGSVHVYGSDLIQLAGTAPTSLRDDQYFIRNIDLPTAEIVFPGSSIDRDYRVAVSYQTTSNGSLRRVDAIVPVVVPLSGLTIDFQTLLGDAGFQGAEPETIRVARLFTNRTGGSFTNDPYEFRFADNGAGLAQEMGAIEFNPLGYNLIELRSDGRRMPLIARIDYDVFDWRVLREEFRVPTDLPAKYQLAVGTLKIQGNSDVDGTPFTGMRFAIPAAGGGVVPAGDFVLMDLQTGGVIQYNTNAQGDPAQSSYRVDKSMGVVTFNDFDGDSTNGLQVRLIQPDGTVSAINASGRPLRALYMGRNEWAVQVYKAAERYRVVYAQPGAGQVYVGGSAPQFLIPPPTGDPGSPTTRLYFSTSDANRKVVVDTVWYRRAGDTAPRLMTNATLSVRSFDALGAYADIRDIDPLASDFDFTYGYAVRGVRGASVNVRVLWNPSVFTLTTNSVTNFTNFERWMRDMRRSSVETYLQRGAAQ